jgi:hypothetical protein
MRMAACVVAVGLLIGAAVGAGPASAGSGESAAVVVSSHAAGARPVAVTLRLGYPMQCGYPGPGPVSVWLPAAMTVPASLAPASVLVDRKPAYRLSRNGGKIVIGLAPPSGIMCDVIGPGTLTITFARTARLGNPRVPGTYHVRAAEGSHAFAAKVAIRRG